MRRALTLPLLALLALAPMTTATSPPLVEVSQAGPIDVTAKPQTPVALPLVLVSLSDEPLLVSFESVEVSHAAGWQVVPPQSVVLRPRGEPGAPANVSVVVMVQTASHNGYVDESFAPSVIIRARPLDNATGPTDEHMVAWRVESRGLYVPTPPALALAGIAVAAMVANRIVQRRR